VAPAATTRMYGSRAWWPVPGPVGYRPARPGRSPRPEPHWSPRTVAGTSAAR